MDEAAGAQGVQEMGSGRHVLDDRGRTGQRGELTLEIRVATQAVDTDLPAGTQSAQTVCEESGTIDLVRPRIHYALEKDLVEAVVVVRDARGQRLNVFAIDSYATFDAAVFYTLGRWELQVNLKNLTDQETLTRGFGDTSVIPALGFNAQASFRYTF